MTTPSRLPESARLDRTYDVEPLAAEIKALRDRPWRAQRAYGGDGLHAAAEIDWRILSLRAPGGDGTRTDPGGAGLVPFGDTPLLADCPALGAVLDSIPAPLRAVRLMALGPDTACHEHRDAKCGLPYGTLRLHVPVITSPEATITLDGVKQHWEAGRLWFGDFDRLHIVSNTGTEDRVHLVIDTLVTPELIALFPADYRAKVPVATVLFARGPKPLHPWELPEFERQFTIPAAYADWCEETLTENIEDGGELPAAVVADNNRLVLHIDGEPAYALVHLGGGDFRLEGWSEERTLHLDPTGRVTLTVRAGSALRQWNR